MVGMAYVHSVAIAVIAQSHSSGSISDADIFVLIVPFFIGLGLGRAWGRRSGLRQLGETEYKNRWRGIKDEF